MKKGFSLVEIIVYCALFALLSVVVINVLITTMRSFADARTNRSLAQAAPALDRAAREARGAVSVDSASSILNTHPGKLKLNSTDDSGNPKTLEFYFESGTLKLKENNVVSGALTPAYLEVTNLIFRTAASPQSAVVKMELSARDRRDRRARVETFTASAVLRGAY